MNKIFVCPSWAGCHLPLYKSYHHFIGAKNINEAKKIMEEWIDREGWDKDNFLVNKIRRDKSCIEMEECLMG
jgi:hypothetical protein